MERTLFFGGITRVAWARWFFGRRGSSSESESTLELEAPSSCRSSAVSRGTLPDRRVDISSGGVGAVGLDSGCTPLNMLLATLRILAIVRLDKRGMMGMREERAAGCGAAYTWNIVNRLT